MPTPMFLQPKGYTAKQDRQVTEALSYGAVGIVKPGDLKVSATSGLGVSVAAGTALIRGSTNADQASYVARTDTASILTHSAVTTNPRLDQIFVTVRDSTEQGGGTDDFTIQIVQGTEAVGVTLDNRTNAGAIPASSILLADVLVSSGPTISIRDRRPYAGYLVPPIKTTTVDTAVPQMLSMSASTGWSDSADLAQYSTPFYLPVKITATKIKWVYRQTSTPLTGNYILGIYDASGRQIVATSSTAFTGAANTTQQRSETITSTTFYPGMYYFTTGLDTTSGLGTNITFNGVTANAAPMSNNTCLYSATGGVTLPTTVLGYTDSFTTFNGAFAVPLFSFATA